MPPAQDVAAQQLTLLAAVQRGEQDALEPLLKLLQPQIYRFGMRLCAHPDDAQDVLQETMLTLARRLREFRGESALSTYIYTVTRSHCLKNRRRRKAAPAVLAPIDASHAQELVSPAPGPDAVLERKEAWHLIAEGLRKIDPAHKEVLVLRDIEGLSAAETSVVVGASVSAVKSKLHRARRALQEAMRTPITLPAGCPDILELFSKEREDELSPSTCERMRVHMEGCSACTSVCNTLKSDLDMCRSSPAPQVPEHVRARIWQALDPLIRVGRA